MRTLPGSRSSGGGQPRCSPGRPGGFQADDPVVAAGVQPRREQAFALRARRLSFGKPRRGRCGLAPAVQGAAQCPGHLDAVRGVGRIEQPGFDECADMGVVQPEGDEPLAGFGGNDAAAQRLSQRQGRPRGAAPIQGGLGRLAPGERDVQPLHLAAQRRELQPRPGHEVLGQRSRRRRAVSLRTQRTGLLRQGCLLLQDRAGFVVPRRLRIRITNGLRSSDRIINLGWAALVKVLRSP